MAMLNNQRLIIAVATSHSNVSGIAVWTLEIGPKSGPLFSLKKTPTEQCEKKNLSFHQKLRYTEKTGWWIGISPIFVIIPSEKWYLESPVTQKSTSGGFFTRPPHPPPILPPQMFPVKLHVLHLHPQRHPVLPLPVRGRYLSHLGEGHLQAGDWGTTGGGPMESLEFGGKNGGTTEVSMRKICFFGGKDWLKMRWFLWIW